MGKSKVRMPGRNTLPASLGAAFLLLSTSLIHAIDWELYDPARHDRFSAGYPGFNTLPNCELFLAGFDLSGIGWNSSPKTAAMISPQHFLTSTHAALGSTIRFINRDGEFRQYTVDSHIRIREHHDDVTIGRLTSPIPATDKVSFYPILSADLSKYEHGREVMYFGQGSKAGRTAIDSLDGPPLEQLFLDRFLIDDENNGDRCFGVGGDSGSPSFIVDNGRLVLLGHHEGPQSDRLLAAYREDVDAVLALDGYALVVLDELCVADFDGDGLVATEDTLAVLEAWGDCPETDCPDALPQPCPEDVNHDGTVDIVDYLAVLGAWGPC